MPSSKEIQKKERKKSWFQRNPKKTVAVFFLLAFFIFFISAEFLLSYLIGFGNPVLYDSSPLYGFRPLPDQQASGRYGLKIKFNNLGLRSNEDWDNNINDKIIFLGDSVTYGGIYIPSDKLFSHLAAESFAGFKSGDAGVNAWGVENIYGLIVESGFLPAKIYITTLPEMDFYRGLTRIQGSAFFNKKPRFALLDLLHYVCYMFNNTKYLRWENSASLATKKKVVENAVLKLKEMDSFLKARGFLHIIFISPDKKQVVNGAGKDPIVSQLLTQYQLNPIYILDQIQAFHFAKKEKVGIFYDAIHLSEKGHQVWANIINRELEKYINQN